MKLPIIIEYNSGDKAIYIAQPPEWSKWEKATGKTVTEAGSKIGIWDLMFLAYNAMKREAAGKPVKGFDVWMDTVSNIEVEESDPKAISREA